MVFRQSLEGGEIGICQAKDGGTRSPVVRNSMLELSQTGKIV